MDAEGDCWEWKAARTSHGYGAFSIQGRVFGAHRVAYRLLVGEMEPGLVIDHLCRNRGCVNPDHLELVSESTNTRRGSLPSQNAARYTRATCKKAGHPLTLTPSGKVCRPCKTENQRRRRGRATPHV